MELVLAVILSVIFFILSGVGLYLFFALSIMQVRLMKLEFQIFDVVLLGLILIILFVSVGACTLGFLCLDSIK